MFVFICKELKRVWDGSLSCNLHGRQAGFSSSVVSKKKREKSFYLEGFFFFIFFYVVGCGEKGVLFLGGLQLNLS